MWLFSAAWAHGPDECPPSSVLEQQAAMGQLGTAGEACLQKSSSKEWADWVRWRNRWAKKPSPRLAEEGRTSALAMAEPEKWVDTAEILALEGKDQAVLLLNAAEEGSGALTQVVKQVDYLERIHRLRSVLDPTGETLRYAQGVAAAGITDERLIEARRRCSAVAEPEACAKPVPWIVHLPPPPVPEDLQKCSDLGRMWAGATIGNSYATERDCLLRAMELTTPGEERQRLGELVAAMALSRRDKGEATIVLRQLSSWIEPDAGIAARAAELHEAAGDSYGASWWKHWGAPKKP